jgi:hypothetical protein
MILALASKSQATSEKTWHPIEIGMTGLPGLPFLSGSE